LFSTQVDDRQDGGDTKPLVADMFKKAKYRDIVSTLEKDVRVKLPFHEFIDICRGHSVDESEARSLAASLHGSGKFLHYSHSKELSSYVLLKPDELALSFAKLLDLKGNFTEDFVARKQKELETLAKEAETFEQRKSELTQRAARNADMCLFSSLFFLGAQGFAVARLTWWELSWDIMEPVTYMLTFTAVFGGFVYFNWTKRDYTYEGLRESMIAKRVTKYLKREGLDQQQYEQVKTKINEIKAQLHAPEVAFLLSKST